MTDTPAGQRRVAGVPLQWWTPLAVLAVLALFLTAYLATASPHTIKRILIRNNSAYDLEITVTGAPHHGWMELATARAHSSTTVNDVIDQGHNWIFHFEAQGESGGNVQITRSDLTANGWTITIPDSVASRLRAAGAPPSPKPDHP